MQTRPFTTINPEKITHYFDFAEACLKVDSEAELCKAINDVNQFFDFDHAICGLAEIKDHFLVETLETVNISFPREWARFYFGNGHHHEDPIIGYHLKHFTPVTWADIDRTAPILNPELLDASQDFGLTDGVICGIREGVTAQGSLFSFSGIAANQRTDTVIRQLDMLSPLLHIALKNYHISKKKDEMTAEVNRYEPLTEREKEVLNWMKIGKTNWEISSILKISERTVKFHVINILKKLNASTRCYAVAKAIHLSIIRL